MAAILISVIFLENMTISLICYNIYIQDLEWNYRQKNNYKHCILIDLVMLLYGRCCKINPPLGYINLPLNHLSKNNQCLFSCNL